MGNDKRRYRDFYRELLRKKYEIFLINENKKCLVFEAIIVTFLLLIHFDVYPSHKIPHSYRECTKLGQKREILQSFTMKIAKMSI